jgi:hypothetical protein
LVGTINQDKHLTLRYKSEAAFNPSAGTVGALIRIGKQEIAYQVAAGAVNFDAAQSFFDCTLCGLKNRLHCMMMKMDLR